MSHKFTPEELAARPALAAFIKALDEMNAAADAKDHPAYMAAMLKSGELSVLVGAEQKALNKE
jgi:hypothetical protein